MSNDANRTTADKAMEPGPIRHLKHNLELRAQKEIRIYGGFQYDLLKDNETGLDIAKAA